MEKKTKPGAIQQLLDYAGDNKKQLYFSTFLATLGELFGMAPFIAVSLLVSGLFNKTATIQNVLILFVVALGGQVLKLWLTYQSSFMSHKATYKILKNIRSTIADKMLRVPMGIMLDTPTGNFKNLMADTVSKLEDSMAHFMPEITSNIVAPLCCIILVFILDWRMGLCQLVEAIRKLVITPMIVLLPDHSEMRNKIIYLGGRCGIDTTVYSGRSQSAVVCIDSPLYRMEIGKKRRNPCYGGKTENPSTSKNSRMGA